jgi:hypothetical protein
VKDSLVYSLFLQLFKKIYFETFLNNFHVNLHYESVAEYGIVLYCIPVASIFVGAWGIRETISLHFSFLI